jgi:hypothetical protein
MTEGQVYLDFNASTPIAREVVEVMRPFLGDSRSPETCPRCPFASKSTRARPWATTSCRSGPHST